jgi:hypothetical protein
VRGFFFPVLFFLSVTTAGLEPIEGVLSLTGISNGGVVDCPPAAENHSRAGLPEPGSACSG